MLLLAGILLRRLTRDRSVARRVAIGASAAIAIALLTNSAAWPFGIGLIAFVLACCAADGSARS